MLNFGASKPGVGGGAWGPPLDPLVTFKCYTIYFNQFQCGGMILEEVPDKMSEALRLFLQGQGYGTIFVSLY